MRLMFELIDECSGQVSNYFLKRNASDEGTGTVDMKDLFSKFTNDVVATVSVFRNVSVRMYYSLPAPPTKSSNPFFSALSV